MEGDLKLISAATVRDVFQSTPSVWRVTLRGNLPAQKIGRISIHTLRVEGDNLQPNTVVGYTKFQSTPSVWRVTTDSMPLTSDFAAFQSTPSVWWVTTDSMPQTSYFAAFQSTPSVWRVTCFGVEIFKRI